jgi:hypothetical protein
MKKRTNVVLGFSRSWYTELTDYPHLGNWSLKADLLCIFNRHTTIYMEESNEHTVYEHT